ncbi:hypothetical protein [Parasitella parasitica]|uniref:F-box domain-containing protein n=1 Tax=Parasitella parasitica TaxID=35722 RepID=A0A0B7NEV5_9FUNG|nr:hypothetical protein [Parasitella parasitica]
MKSTPCLPNEILDLIASYLFFDNCQDHQCLRTCSSWYKSFQPSLCRRICIKTRRQFSHLVTSIKHNASIGLYVRHLYIQDQVGLSRDQIESLPLLFPLLETLYFNPGLWKYQRRAGRVEEQGMGWHRRLTALPPLDCYNTTLPLIESLGSRLRELVLMGGIVNPLHRMHQNVSTKGKSVLLCLLDSTPRLRSLTLYGRDKQNAQSLQDCSRAEFSLDDMARLHASLPCLASLTLVDVALSKTAKEQQVPITAPAVVPQMRKFHVQQSLLGDFHWIGYVAELYPHLRDLNLDVSWDPLYRQTLTWMDTGPIQAALFKLAQLQSLQYVSLGQIESVFKPQSSCAGGSRFYEHLSKVTPGLVSLDNTCSGRSLSGTAASSLFASFMACTHPDITERLKVQLWRDFGGMGAVMPIIGSCRKLTELELHGGNFSYSWRHGCDVDVIVKYCPQLETLTLNATRLMSSPKNGDVSKGLRVKTIRLIQVHFTTAAFDVLADCCPNLEHLELIDCVKDRDSLAHRIHLSLPHQHLKTLIVQHLHLRPSQYVEKSSIDAAIVALDFSDRARHNLNRNSSQLSQRWYHLYCHKTKKGRCRQMRRLGFLESRQVQDYSMEDTDWDHLEENSIRGTYREAKYWDSDIPYGYLQVDCKFIDAFVFNRVRL